MIVYRVQGSTGDGWATQWEPTADDARATARAVAAAGFADVKVDRLEIPAGREAFVDALNHADANRAAWGDGGKIVAWR